MADADRGSVLDGRRRPEPDRLSVSGRSQRVPQAGRDRVQAHRRRSAAARRLSAGRRRPSSAGGDDPRRRLGARRPLRDGPDQVGRAISPPAAWRSSRSTIGWRRRRPIRTRSRIASTRSTGPSSTPRRSAPIRPASACGATRPAATWCSCSPPRRPTRRSAVRACAAAATRLRAAVALYPPTDLLALDDAERRGRAGTRTVRDLRRRRPGRRSGALARRVADRARARRLCRRSSSCRARATSSSRIRRRTRFAERLAAVGAPHRLEIVDGGVHGFDRVAPASGRGR